MNAVSSLAAAALLIASMPASPAGARDVEEESYRSHPYLSPVGDLDGDGREDLVGIGQIPSTGYRLTAYRGTDGAVLWTHEESGGIQAIPARVGLQGNEGVLLVVGSGGGAGAFVGYNGGVVDYAPQELALVALTGAGQELWRREFAGELPTLITSEHLDSATDLPFFGGTLRATASPADDMLVLVHDYVLTPAGQDNHLSALVIDGADGATAATYDEQIGAAEGTVRPAPDLSGDGLDDVLVFEDATSGPDTITALRGSSGSVLWDTSAHAIDVGTEDYAGRVPGIAQRVVFLGDASGDGTSDIGYSLATNPSTPFVRTFSLIDGATGETRFTELGDLVRAVGDVDDDGMAEIGVQNLVQSQTQAGAAYETYDGEGTIERFAEHTFGVPEGSSSSVSLLPSVGDVDGDGVDDAAHSVSLSQDGQTELRDLVVSGKGYEAIGEGLLATALRATVDGSGDDVAQVLPFGQSVIDVLVRDGATGAELWKTRLRPRGQSTRSTFIRAVDVTGDGLAEILVSAENFAPGTLPSNLGGDVRHVDSFVLSAVDGSVLWQSP